MPRGKVIRITVTTVFDGKQDDRQAFIELILNKRRTFNTGLIPIDVAPRGQYTNDKVFSDVRV